MPALGRADVPVGYQAARAAAASALAAGRDARLAAPRRVDQGDHGHEGKDGTEKNDVIHAGRFRSDARPVSSRQGLQVLTFSKRGRRARTRRRESQRGARRRRGGGAGAATCTMRPVLTWPLAPAGVSITMRERCGDSAMCTYSTGVP